MAAALGPPLYFEDYSSETTLATMVRLVTTDDLDAYVQLAGFDEDLFTSEAAARASIYARRIIPGSFTFALSEGLVIKTGAIRGVGLAFLGINDLRIPLPVYVGDSIRVVATFVDKRLSKKNADAGIVTTHNRVLNQNDQTTMHFEVVRLIRRHYHE